MTSRERVWNAINHREPDRVPLDLNGTCCTALTYVAYNNIREFLGFPADPDPFITSMEMGSVRSLDDLLLHYKADTRTLALKAPLVSKGTPVTGDSYYDEYGIRWRQASYYYDAVERPLAAATIKDLDNMVLPDFYDPGRIAGLREEARNLFENTSYCLVADMPAFGPFEGCCLTRGYDQYCIDLCMDPLFAETLLDKITDAAIAAFDVLLGEVGDYIQVIALGDDVSTQTSPFISPEMYKQFVKPRHKRIFDFIHARTSAKIFYHSCGAVYDMIPDFIEEGVDILNPVQRSAAKMNIIDLKREYGKDICFWGGGIDVQNQLPVYSAAQVEDEVKRTIDILAPGGGFVFFPTHNIQADVSAVNIDCMFNTVLNYSR
jgi:uroporphyrinogen decarboxylase